MVSSGQFVGMGMAIVLPVLVVAVLYIIVNRHSRKIETGMMGAVGYGALGYLWQQLLYLMAAQCNRKSFRYLCSGIWFCMQYFCCPGYVLGNLSYQSEAAFNIPLYYNWYWFWIRKYCVEYFGSLQYEPV